MATRIRLLKEISIRAIEASATAKHPTDEEIKVKKANGSNSLCQSLLITPLSKTLSKPRVNTKDWGGLLSPLSSCLCC